LTTDILMLLSKLQNNKGIEFSILRSPFYLQTTIKGGHRLIYKILENSVRIYSAKGHCWKSPSDM